LSKPRRFVFCADNHGDHADPATLAVFWEFLKFWKPEVRVHGGDCFDFRCLRKNASEGEKRDRIQADIDAGCDFLRKLKPTHWLRGNHDERLMDAAKGDDGKLADFASYLWVDIKDAAGAAQILPYDKRAGVLRIGRLKMIHGYHGGVTAARLAAQVYGSVLMGHTHAIDHAAVPGLDSRVGRSVGALCNLQADYNRAHANTLRQAHGWGYGLLLPGGEYVYWQAQRVGGAWHFPSEIREVRA
jgi:hypothetical protein